MKPVWKRARRNRVDIIVHLVWTTAQRRPLLLPDYEAIAYDAVRIEAVELGCRVLALGGMPDHVHLLVDLPSTVSIAQVLQRVKGVSSARVRAFIYNADPSPSRPFFAWADGYGVFSVTPDPASVERVCRYIENQKMRHEPTEVDAVPDGGQWLDRQ